MDIYMQSKKMVDTKETEIIEKLNCAIDSYLEGLELRYKYGTIEFTKEDSFTSGQINSLKWVKMYLNSTIIPELEKNNVSVIRP